MFKLNFSNILLYILVKYFVLYGVLMIKGSNTKLLEIGSIKNGEDLFYYLWVILFLPIVCMIIFSAPLYFTLKVKGLIKFISLITLIFIAEFFLYTYLASQADYINGIINAVIGLLLLFIFFYKSIIALTK